ncbi:purine permease 21-like [Pistacia vera]|uniref:purine permease 21-like n=1 Tax=Pistacia vera TaxID=55513 RepID=UPI001263BC20|nr:purine permease 21-like [Pistacia vera]
MEIIDIISYPSIVATCDALVGLFANGEWKSLSKEMELYELGKVAYVMTIVWATIAWQVFSVGLVGLIFEVSSLFCNSISILGFPIFPVLGVVFFHDKIDGVKVISMVLAIWGIVSYVYQQYLDESKPKNDSRIAN